eukprot:gb/GECG01014218.1/.p1 GENE.gb/GECG01014218.1/~~gb/GECG01014218.1/.p1  ORF type:complete len:842 (+),score=110.78 gb/GECG01014218.1/:1-2526(+)
MTQIQADINLIQLLDSGEFADWTIKVYTPKRLADNAGGYFGDEGKEWPSTSSREHRYGDSSTRSESGEEIEQFEVHSPIIALSSEYFKRVLEQRDFKETRERTTELHFPEAVRCYFRLVLRYMYGATVHINCANVVQLFVLSDQLIIRQLLQKCCQLISEQCEHDDRLDHFQILVNSAYRCGQAASPILDVCMHTATTRHWDNFADEPVPLPQQFTLSLLMRKVLQIAVKLDDSIVVERESPEPSTESHFESGGLYEKFGKLRPSSFDVYSDLNEINVDKLRKQVSKVLLFELKRCINAVKNISSRFRADSEDEDEADERRQRTQDEKVDVNTSMSLGNVMQIINRWIPSQRKDAEEILGMVIFAERYNSVFHVAKSLPVLKAYSMMKLFVKVSNIKANLDSKTGPSLYKRYRNAANPTEEDLKYWELMLKLTDRMFHHLAIITSLVFYSRPARKLLRQISLTQLQTLLDLDELYVESEDEVVMFILDTIRYTLNESQSNGYTPTEKQFQKMSFACSRLFHCIRWEYVSDKALQDVETKIENENLLPSSAHFRQQLGEVMRASQENEHGLYVPPRFSYANRKTLLLPAYSGEGSPGRSYHLGEASYELPRIHLSGSYLFHNIAPQILTRDSEHQPETRYPMEDADDETDTTAWDGEGSSYALIRADAALSSYQQMGGSLAIQPYRGSLSPVLEATRTQRSQRNRGTLLEDWDRAFTQPASENGNYRIGDSDQLEETSLEDVPPLSLEESALRVRSLPSEVTSDDEPARETRGDAENGTSASSSSQAPSARGSIGRSRSIDVEETPHNSPMFISMNRRALLRKNYCALRDKDDSSSSEQKRE